MISQSAWFARALLLLAAVLTLSILVGPRLDPPPLSSSSSAAAGTSYTDRELYREIVRKVAAGQDYYAAAAAAQRAHGYPTAPPWAFREPTEAWLLALLPNEMARWGALLLLVAAAVVLMRDAAEQATASASKRPAVALLSASAWRT